MKPEFKSYNKWLGQILYAFANYPLNPELRIACAVKDSEAVKNTLLFKAVKDTIDKADMLKPWPVSR